MECESSYIDATRRPDRGNSQDNRKEEYLEEYPTRGAVLVALTAHVECVAVGLE